MVSFFLFVARRLPMAFGALGIWFAVERWSRFHTLPRHASARFCGNCFLAAVGVPTELGLLGLLVLAISLLKIPCCNRNVIPWCCAAMGIFLTPAIIGAVRVRIFHVAKYEGDVRKDPAEAGRRQQRVVARRDADLP